LCCKYFAHCPTPEEYFRNKYHLERRENMILVENLTFVLEHTIREKY
jgi:hypothetical protein